MEKEHLVRLLAELDKLRKEHLHFKRDMAKYLPIIEQQMNEVDVFLARIERYKK